MRIRRVLLLLALAGASLAFAVVPSEDAALADAPRAETPPRFVPPDPQPLVEKRQWVFDLRWDRGEVFLIGVHAIELPAPQATPRAIGRFAMELWEGATLVERVRFDFPMLGASESDGGIRFAPRLTTRIGVMFPATKRGTKLVLWDRSTDQRWTLPWPPAEGPFEAPAAGASRDAGAGG